MKANELMIGDWVHIAPTVQGRPEYDTQVYGIGPDVILVKKDSGANSIEYDRVIPIPLTAEILEKNFLQQKVDACDMAEGYDCAEFHDDKGHYFVYDLDSGVTTICDPFPTFSVGYVHELQHALRLCGLRELADNFKID